MLVLDHFKGVLYAGNRKAIDLILGLKYMILLPLKV
jgi:hypothetical protein